MRSHPRAMRSATASAMKGCQYRMPTLTGTGLPRLAETLFEPCSNRLGDVGQRRAAADGQVPLADRFDQLVGWLAVHEVAHERPNGLDGLGAAEAEQQNAGARHAYAPAPPRMRSECLWT